MVRRVGLLKESEEPSLAINGGQRRGLENHMDGSRYTDDRIATLTV